MKMPVLRPVPIKTKGLPFRKRIKAWIAARQWEIAEDWLYFCNGEYILIRKGFILDLASVPRLFWWILSPTGILLIPGVLHDNWYKYGYYEYKLSESSVEIFRKPVTKKESDRMFYNVSLKVNGNYPEIKFMSYIAFLSVGLFGFLAWNGHRKNDVKKEITNDSIYR